MSDVERLRALEAAATPGPWFSMPGQGVVGIAGIPISDRRDRDLIVAARNALPRLLDRLKAAESALARVEALADEWDETASLQLAANPQVSPVVAIGHATHRLRAALGRPGGAVAGAEDADGELGR